MLSSSRSVFVAFGVASISSLALSMLFRLSSGHPVLSAPESLVALCAPFLVYGLTFGAIYPKRFREALFGLLPIVILLAAALIISILLAQNGTGDMRGFLGALVIRTSIPILAIVFIGILAGMPLRRILGPALGNFLQRFARIGLVSKIVLIVSITLAALYFWCKPLISKLSVEPSTDEFSVHHSGPDEP